MRDGALSSSWRTVDHPVRLTRHGPLVEIRGRLYALRWTALDDAVELPAFAGAGPRRELGRVPGGAAPVPRALAELRLRRRGRPHRVVLGGPPAHPPRAATARGPTRAPSPDGDWIGYVPVRRRCPTSWIRPSGRIVTANNRLVGTDYPARVTRGGIGPWRAAALFESLEARDGMDGRRHGAAAGRAAVDPPPRPGARAAGGGGPPSRRRGVGRGRGEMSGLGRPHGAGQPRRRRWPSPPSAPSGERVIGAARRARCPSRREPQPARVAAIHRLVLERPPALGAGRRRRLGRRAARRVAATRRATGRAALGDDRARWTLGRDEPHGRRPSAGRASGPWAPLLSPPAVEMGGSRAPRRTSCPSRPRARSRAPPCGSWPTSPTPTTRAS